MADEISQVVEMEYKGVYYLFKGSKAMIALMAKAIKALTDRHHTKYLNKPGNCDWKKMQEMIVLNRIFIPMLFRGVTMPKRKIKIKNLISAI